MYNSPMTKRLTKSHDKKLFGVAGGIAEYLNVDPTILRVAFVVLCFVFLPIIPIAYGALVLLMPSANEDSTTVDEAGKPAEDTANSRHNLLAWALIGFGLLIVLSRLGFPHPGNGWLLPLALVGIGVALLTRRSRLN